MSAGADLDRLDSEAHVWLTGPAGPEALPELAPLLDEAELAQYERYKVERARALHLAARALARSVLSLYAPAIDPREWRFRFNEHGRPEIDGPVGGPPLRFNLSHTDGLVACLVTLRLDAGVDVERIDRELNLTGVARHSFSAREAADVRRRRGRDQRQRFFHYWTLKEAYIKARGMGLALPLRRFSYTFPSSGEVAIELDPELGDRAGDWQLALYQAAPEHYLATAIRRGGAADREIVIRRSTPLATECRELTPARLLASAPVGTVFGDDSSESAAETRVPRTR